MGLDLSALGKAGQGTRQQGLQSAAISGNQLLDWHQAQATDAEQENRWFAAVWHISRLVELKEGDASLYNRRSRAYEQLREWDRARADCTRAIVRGDKDVSLWFRRGRFHLLQKRWQPAMQDLIRATSLDRADGAAWLARHVAHARLGQWDEARTAFEQAKRRANTVWVLAPQWRLCEGQQPLPAPWAQLETNLKDLMEVPPGETQWWMFRARGLTLCVLGQWRDADSHLDSALKLYKQADRPSKRLLPDPEPDRDCLATVRIIATGMPRQARWDSDMPRPAAVGLVPDPKSQPPERRLALAWLAALRPVPRQYQRPLVRCTRQTVELLPGSYEAQKTLGAVLFRAGELKDAITHLKQAARMRQFAPETWILLAMAHNRLGESKEGQRWWDRTQEWLPELERLTAGLNRKPLAFSWQDRLALEMLLQEVGQSSKPPETTPTPKEKI
jgi:Flp pilus assembly protein TadD